MPYPLLSMKPLSETMKIFKLFSNLWIFSRISIKYKQSNVMKLSYAKCRPFCLEPNVWNILKQGNAMLIFIIAQALLSYRCNRNCWVPSPSIDKAIKSWWNDSQNLFHLEIYLANWIISKALDTRFIQQYMDKPKATDFFREIKSWVNMCKTLLPWYTKNLIHFWFDYSGVIGRNALEVDKSKRSR